MTPMAASRIGRLVISYRLSVVGGRGFRTSLLNRRSVLSVQSDNLPLRPPVSYLKHTEVQALISDPHPTLDYEAHRHICLDPMRRARVNI